MNDLDEKKEDIIRVLRIIEYVGERSRVEKTIEESIHGCRTLLNLTIRVATIGEYPEILERSEKKENDNA